MSPEVPASKPSRPAKPAETDTDSGNDPCPGADANSDAENGTSRWPIRAATVEDWPELWREVLQPVFAAGETYSFAPDIRPDAARAAWLEQPDAAFVATDPASGALLGSYYIKPNRPGLGAHICNCGYAVAPAARGPVCRYRASGRWTTAAIATLSASVQSASPSRQAQCAMFGTRGGAAGRTNVSAVSAPRRHGIASGVMRAWYARAASFSRFGSQPSNPRPPAATNCAATASTMRPTSGSGTCGSWAAAARRVASRTAIHGLVISN